MDGARKVVVPSILTNKHKNNASIEFRECSHLAFLVHYVRRLFCRVYCGAFRNSASRSVAWNFLNRTRVGNYIKPSWELMQLAWWVMTRLLSSRTILYAGITQPETLLKTPACISFCFLKHETGAVGDYNSRWLLEFCSSRNRKTNKLLHRKGKFLMFPSKMAEQRWSFD